MSQLYQFTFSEQFINELHSEEQQALLREHNSFIAAVKSIQELDALSLADEALDHQAAFIHTNEDFLNQAMEAELTVQILENEKQESIQPIQNPRFPKLITFKKFLSAIVHDYVFHNGENNNSQPETKDLNSGLSMSQLTFFSMIVFGVVSLFVPFFAPVFIGTVGLFAASVGINYLVIKSAFKNIDALQQQNHRQALDAYETEIPLVTQELEFYDAQIQAVFNALNQEEAEEFNADDYLIADDYLDVDDLDVDDLVSEEPFEANVEQGVDDGEMDIQLILTDNLFTPAVTVAPVVIPQAAQPADAPVVIHQAAQPAGAPVVIHQAAQPADAAVVIHQTAKPNDAAVVIHQTAKPEDAPVVIHQTAKPNDAAVVIHLPAKPEEAAGALPLIKDAVSFFGVKFPLQPVDTQTVAQSTAAADEAPVLSIHL